MSELLASRRDVLREILQSTRFHSAVADESMQKLVLLADALVEACQGLAEAGIHEDECPVEWGGKCECLASLGEVKV